MKHRPWTADYKPPAPPDENSNVKKTPEEIEREIKESIELFNLLVGSMQISGFTGGSPFKTFFGIILSL